MTYVTSVGGDPINPIVYTYTSISMTSDITLVWPSNTQNPTYTATDWVDITSSGSYAITMPPANEAGTGNEVVFYNFGSNTVTINNSDSGNITTVASGETKRIWITDNSTAAGTWRIANIGSGTTSADASMLAGYGMVAIAGTLNQSFPPIEFSSPNTLDSTTRAALALWLGGVGTFTLARPITLGSNWFCAVKNSGTGLLTVDGQGALIDGLSSVTVSLNEGFTIACDGAAFYTIGRITPDTSGYTFLAKSVTGSTDITLSASESVYNIIQYTGTLGASINVIVPSQVNEWVMNNSSTGSAYTLTIKTSGGTGEVLSQGATRQLYSDGTDVFFSDVVDVGGVSSVDTGTGLGGGPITTSGTIYIQNTGVIAGTYGSSSRIPICVVNAQGQLTSSTDTPLSVTSAVGTLPVSHGGTGSTTLTLNSVLLGNGTSSLQSVSPNTTNNVLTASGTTWVSSAVSITNATGILPVSSGGTNSTTLTLNNVILGNGTSAPQFVAPGTSGNVLTSDGTTWNSSASPIKKGTALTLNPYAANTATTGAHGLSSAPNYYLGYLECLSTEGGYSVGDRVNISSSCFAQQIPLFTIWSNSTDWGFNTGSGAFPDICNKTSGATVTITAANWKLVMTPCVS